MIMMMKKKDTEPVEVENNNSPPGSAVSSPSADEKPTSTVSDNTAEILPSLPIARVTRSHSEASVNVLQAINEQRRFSVSATSARGSTAAGGVTGQSSALH